MNAEINPNILKKVDEQPEYIKDFLYEILELEYKCRDLRANDKQTYLDMDVNLPLNYFLVDDGDINGGMFLASAYQHLIEWQNSFLNEIISKNNKNGILHSYISHLEEQTSVQEATKDEIINIDDQTFQTLEVLISKSLIKNASSNDKNNNIIYKNDNDIIYNF